MSFPGYTGDHARESVAQTGQTPSKLGCEPDPPLSY